MNIRIFLVSLSFIFNNNIINIISHQRHRASKILYNWFNIMHFKNYLLYIKYIMHEKNRHPLKIKKIIKPHIQPHSSHHANTPTVSYIMYLYFHKE